MSSENSGSGRHHGIKMPIDKLFAELVKKFRSDNGISQERLAVALAVPVSTVKRMELDTIDGFFNKRLERKEENIRKQLEFD